MILRNLRMSFHSINGEVLITDKKHLIYKSLGSAFE